MDLPLAEATRAEFTHSTTYLNTATCAILPRSAVIAVRELAEAAGAGIPAGFGDFDRVNRVRDAFARLVGVASQRVAVGSAVATHVGLVAASLPTGAEVLCPEGEFASVINPFVVRGDLKVRFAPLESMAEAVGGDTALVALSVVQSADGRTADLASVREAAAGSGARMLVDATQAVGWLPFDASPYAYTVTAGYKWLLGSRGASYLTVSEEAQGTLTPLHAGWVAAESMWDATYGPMPELAHGARRFDESPAFLAYHAAAASLDLLERIGIEAIHAHDTALAARYRAGLARLGHDPVPGESPIVSVPGLAHRQPALLAAGIATAARAGALRASFHLYNTEADVDRLLNALSD
ncbi:MULTISPECIES: aminotransferase class V-fold PLP-dependent enzyme [unclassified Streptomyces]|uniref:aminotransferase class V-fold PLP-dependent enzyme n=1 Tax=unclassified Streptomyces TaxID=2593676 RepID=UPI001BE71381|nr:MULTISPECIES: aminotransferase class V-fold PLP-dependent enzyme [unclassified Streptomyces]MBT2408211.1 aminotransferase class V-fold PLP-dependent enzyme [Streptomyces sp. ISL-21]MBT2456445.1 aminotransferase class V-fold PLP-dependent enzyme [Streptomyces sp. ISL-86]MBT2607636.1 aminotransferase class V-fold PLP-dependent enzyme [Streptomyces sp. ISL-87]